MDEEAKDLSVITTSGTSGLASILQITDDTPNEVFTFRHSTSGTETVVVVNVPDEGEGIPTSESEEH